MHKLLGDWLNKLNIGVDKLTPEEKKTFDTWQSILEREVTVDSILEFCKRQQNLIESKWMVSNRDRTHDTHLADLHGVYKQIIHVIEAPANERAQIEREIERLLDT